MTDDNALRAISQEVDELAESIMHIVKHPQEAGDIDGMAENLGFLVANFLNDVHRIADALAYTASVQKTMLEMQQAQHEEIMKQAKALGNL